MLHPTLRRIGPLFACLALACNGSKADRAAKARIFSPEEPSVDVRKANEPIAADRAAADGAVWKRLWRMDRLEVTHRVGAHKATSKVTFHWKRGEKGVELTEDATFATDAAGQFHAATVNDQDTGMEFVWVGGKAYAKGRYGDFHIRRNDRSQQDRWRDEATSALRTAFDLFGRRLHGAPQGTVSLPDGHVGRRYTLSLGEPWGPADVASTAPKAAYGKVRVAGREESVEDAPDGGVKDAPGGNKDSRYHPGPDEDTARRLEFDHRRIPESVSGEITVDETAAVIAKAHFTARFRVPESTPQSGATLELNVVYDLQPESSLTIEPPKDVSAPRLPHAVNNPLWFVTDGGTGHNAAGTDEDEPDTSEDEAPAPHSGAAH